MATVAAPVQGTKKEREFVSVPVDYLGKRDKEKGVEGDPKMQRAFENVDDLYTHSVPGRVDQFELSQIEDPKAIQSYIEAREKIDGANRRWQIAKLVSGVAGSAAAMVASFFAGGWALFGVTVGLGIIGNIASKFMGRKIKDPRSIENIKKFDPKVGEMLEKLDRPETSRPHWTDYDEFERLTPKQQEAYEEAVVAIEKHNDYTKLKVFLGEMVGKIASYAGMGLPLFLKSIPGIGTIGRIVGFVGGIGGAIFGAFNKGKVVETRDADDLTPLGTAYEGPERTVKAP